MRIYEGSPRQDFEEVFRSIGAFIDQRGMHEVLLVEAPDGFIVQGIVSSGGGVRGFPHAAVYNGTKAAQRGFAEALRHELHGSGVSVTTVYPGEIATSLHDHEYDVAAWFPIDEAERRLAFANERLVVAKARAEIEGLADDPAEAADTQAAS